MITNEEARDLAAWLESIGAPLIGLGAADKLAALYSKVSAMQDQLQGTRRQEAARRLRRACLDIAIIAMAQVRARNPHDYQEAVHGEGSAEQTTDGGGRDPDAGRRPVSLEPSE